jgi:hypothetical protein
MRVKIWYRFLVLTLTGYILYNNVLQCNKLNPKGMILREMRVRILKILSERQHETKRDHRIVGYEIPRTPSLSSGADP